MKYLLQLDKALSLIGSIEKRDFLPRFAEAVKQREASGEMPDEAWPKLFRRCCEESFNVYQGKLISLGVTDFNVFEGYLRVFFNSDILRIRERWRKAILNGEPGAKDPADLLSQLEEINGRQGKDPDSQQRSWEKELEFFKDLIPYSAKWKKELCEITKSINSDFGQNIGEDEVLSEAFIGIIENTGPKKIKKRGKNQGKARALNDIVSTSYLKNKFRPNEKEVLWNDCEGTPQVLGDRIDKKLLKQLLLDQVIRNISLNGDEKDSEIFKLISLDYTQEEISIKTGFTQSTISRRIRLMREKLKKT